MLYDLGLDGDTLETQTDEHFEEYEGKSKFTNFLDMLMKNITEYPENISNRENKTN